MLRSKSRSSNGGPDGAELDAARDRLQADAAQVVDEELEELGVPQWPHAQTGEELAIIERADAFNRAKAAKEDADRALGRARRVAGELVSSAESIAEQANDTLRGARLALRRSAES